MSPVVGQVALGIYAVLLAGGGVMGYRKAGSRPSLIAGVVSGVVALAGLVWSVAQPGSRGGLLLGMTLAFVMALVFLRRFGMTRKVMPSGLLAVLSIVMVILLLAVITTQGSPSP